jgi:hypothetical protein
LGLAGIHPDVLEVQSGCPFLKKGDEDCVREEGGHYTFCFAFKRSKVAKIQ